MPRHLRQLVMLLGIADHTQGPKAIESHSWTALLALFD